MPFVDIVSEGDYASIWYWTTVYNSTVGIFDLSKPTLVLLHPVALDSSWMQPQAEDPRLHNNYNIVMFDTRITGRSQSRFNGKYDLWVAAADLAQAFYQLRLPPAHIFAPDLSAQIALRFASLFPESCLSLTLCNCAPPTEIKTFFDVCEELTRLFGYAEDLETFEYACKEYLNYYGGPYAHPDLADEIVTHWETFYPPFRRSWLMALMNLTLNRTPMSQKELAAVKCPVLIIQAETSPAHPYNLAEQLADELVNVPGGAKMFKVKGSAGYLSIVSANIVNQVFCKFLSQQQGWQPPPPDPSNTSNAYPYECSQYEFMRRGLQRLADFKEDSSISDRKPLSSLSFTCTAADVVKSQDETIATYSKGSRTAFSPLGSDGRPMRKFSERQGHWLDAGSDGFSRSDASRAPDLSEKRKRPIPKPRPEEPKSSLVGIASTSMSLVTAGAEEPVSLEAQQVARARRNVLGLGSVEKQVLKGNLHKIAASPSNMPRLLR